MVGMGTILFLYSPLLLLFINRRFRDWIRGGIEGEDKKLDISEVQKAITYFLMLGCFYLFALQVIFYLIFSTPLEWNLLLYCFIGFASTEALAAVQHIYHTKKPPYVTGKD